MVTLVTSKEKTLQLRLNYTLLRIREWEKEWDPELAKVGNTTKRYWMAFHRFLKVERARLEKELDQVNYIDVL